MVEGEKSRVLMQITGSDTDKIFEWFEANKDKFNIEVLYTMGIMPSEKNLAKPLGFCALLKANKNNMIDELVRIKSEAEKMNDWECNFLKTSELSIRNINSNLNPLIFKRKVSSGITGGQFCLFNNYYRMEANYKGKILHIVVDGKFLEVYYRGEYIKSYLFKNFSKEIKRRTNSLGKFKFYNTKRYDLGKKYTKREIIIKLFRNHFDVYIKGKFIKKIFPGSGNS